MTSCACTGTADLADRESGTVVAVAVVPQRIKVHEAGTRPGAFRAVGRVAVRNALVQAYGPPPRPKRRRGWGRGRGHPGPGRATPVLGSGFHS
ncbi:hypothetical protein NRF20_21075 [Streptomyces sp. R-74717]|uniref:hypothetical protein n=1 Tax=Streptomyces TaxID=1883 RepID=UPI00379B72F4